MLSSRTSAQIVGAGFGELYPEVWKFVCAGAASPCRGAPRQGRSLWYSMEFEATHGETRMDRQKDTAVEAVLEHLIEHGPSDIATVLAGRSSWPCRSSGAVSARRPL